MNAGLIKLILNLALLAFCLFGFLIGLLRGVKKAGLRIGVFFAFIVIIALVTPLFSGLLSGIKFSFLDNMNLVDYFSNLINNSPEINSAMLDMPALANLINQLPLILVNIVTYIILLYVLGFVGFITYLIIKGIIFKKNKNKSVEPKVTIINGTPVVLNKPEKQKKHRLLGGLVGAVQGFCLLMFTLLPLTGLATMVNGFIYNNSVSASQTQTSKYTFVGQLLIDENILNEEILGYIDAYNNAIVTKTSSIFHLDTLGLDTIAKVNVNGESVKFRHELTCIIEAVNQVPFMYDIIKNGEQFDFKNLSEQDFDNLENAIDTLLDSKMLKIVLPELLTYSVNNLEIKITENIDISTNIQNVIDVLCDENAITTLKSDIKAFIKTAKVLSISGLINEFQKTEIDTKGILNILKKDNNTDGKDFDVAFELVDNILTSTTLKNVLAEAINVGIIYLENLINDSMLPETYSENVEISRIDISRVNWADTTDSLKLMIKNGINLYDEFYESNIKTFEDFLELKYNKIVSYICEIANQLFNSPILAAGVNYTNVSSSLMNAFDQTIYGEYFKFSNLNHNSFWSENSSLIVEILDYIKDFNQDYKLLKKQTGKDETNLTLFDYLSIVDFDTTQNLLNSILDSQIANGFKTDVIKYAKDVKFESGEYSENLQNGYDNLIDRLVDNNHFIDDIKSDVLAVFNITKHIYNSDLYELLQNEEIDLIELFEVLKAVDNEDKTLADNITIELFDANNLKYTLVELLNVGIEIVEDYLLSLDSESSGLTKIDIENFEDWSLFETQVKNVLSNINDVKFNDETLVLNFNGENIFIDFDILSVIDFIGNTLQDLRDLEVLKYENKNIVDDIIIEFNKTFDMFDLSTLTGDGNIKEQFNSLKSVIKDLFDSNAVTYMSDYEFNFENIDISKLANLILVEREIDEQSKSYANTIITELLESTLMRSYFKNLLIELNNSTFIEFANNLSTQENPVVLKLNIESIDDTTTIEQNIKLIESIVKFIAHNDLDILLNNAIDSILESEFSLTGEMLDNIKNSKLFGAIESEGYQGFYNSLIDAFMQDDYSNIIDFTVAKENDFSWKEDLAKVENALEILKSTKINDDGVERTLFEYLAGGGEFNTALENLDNEDIDIVVSSLSESKLFSGVVKSVLNIAVEELKK